MKAAFSLTLVLGLFMLAGCGSQQAETMVLLDEKISEVKISKSKGIGDMNEDPFLFLKDEDSLNILEKAITSAVKQSEKVDTTVPDYDVFVEYESNKGDLPTHGLHLWLGKENEQSMFTYLTDDSVYLTSAAMTQKLKELLEN